MENSEGNSLSTILLLAHFSKDIERRGCTRALNCKTLMIRGRPRSRPRPVFLSDSHFLLGFRLAHFTGSMKSTIVTIDGSADGSNLGALVFSNVLPCVGSSQAQNVGWNSSYNEEYFYDEGSKTLQLCREVMDTPSLETFKVSLGF